MKQTLFVLPSKDSLKKFDVPAQQQSMQRKQVYITKIYLMESFNISLLLSFLSAGWLGSNFRRSAKAPLTFCCLNLSLKLQFWQVIHQNMPIKSLCTCDLRIFFSCIWMVEAWPRLRSSEPGTPDLATLSSRDGEDSPGPRVQSDQRLESRSHCMICSLQHWPRPRRLQSGHTQTPESWSSPRCRHTRSRSRNLMRIRY